MRRKVRINLDIGYLSDFTVKKTTLCLHPKFQRIKGNENILILNAQETKSKDIYNIKLIKSKQGVCYIKSSLKEDLDLEIVNRTTTNGELKISGLSLYKLKTKGFKKIIVEDSNINSFTYDAKEIEVCTSAKVKKMICSI